AISDDGKLMAISSPNSFRVLVSNAENGKGLRAFREHTGNVRQVTFVPGTHRVLSAGFDGTVRLWRADTGAELHCFTHGPPVWGVAVSQDGKRFVSGGADGIVRVWGVEGELIAQGKGHTAGVHGVAILPDGKRVLSASSDRSVRLWDAATGKQLQLMTG